MVLIEGDQSALERLAGLLLDHARSPESCGWQAHPKGPGKVYFSRQSDLGIYIHRLPCWDPSGKER